MTKKNVSAIVSGAGWIGSFATELIKMLRERGVSDEDIHSLVTEKGKLPVSKIADVLVEAIRPWRKQEDGIICFTVISDGTTGPEWIDRLEKKGFQISKWAKDVLRSAEFKSTKGITTEVAVLPGNMFNDGDRTTKKIRAEAKRCNLTVPNAEVSCLIREKFSDEELMAMGFWWIAIFHEPIKDSHGDPYLLVASRHGDGRWLHTSYAYSDYSWNSPYGFAFAVSQLSLFLFYFLGEFCFSSCPSQPPSILPTSFSFKDRVIYFLLSNDLVIARDY